MCLLSIAFALVVLALGTLVALVLGLTTEQTKAIDSSRWLQLLFVVMGAVVTLLVTKQILGKNWPEFRIALIARQPSPTSSGQNSQSGDTVA
jgi:sulfite exporter TauE/SafE